MPAESDKSLESWLWDAACSIRGAKDAPKFKDFILPLVFTKRLCDVFDDEINRIAKEVRSRGKAFKLVKADKKLVRFFLPLQPRNPDDSVWSVIRTGNDVTRPASDKYQEKLGQELTTYLRDIADANPLLKGIIDRIDFNATTHGQRDIDDTRLSNLIEAISGKRLGLKDVEPDIIGRSYEYLIRKFAEGGGQSAGEFYTPAEVGIVMARIMDAEPGMDVYDSCCGSAGLLIKCELVLAEKMSLRSRKNFAPAKLYGQEFTATTWAMANMNMIIHDMEATLRGSGNANSNKEKEVRKWFVEQDFIEGVIYLPENLFYNTTAPGVVIILNKANPKSRQGKLFLVNASREFSKGDPKNYLPEESVALHPTSLQRQTTSGPSWD